MNYHAYRFFGSHPEKNEEGKGFRFRVWAPAAKGVSVVGDFNQWDPHANPLTKSLEGIWKDLFRG